MTHRIFPLVESGTWQGREKKSPALWKMSSFAKLTCPSWWILILSWRSSSCPSSPSSYACLGPCALHLLLIPTSGWCPLVHLACWGRCFLPSPPSSVNPTSRDDYRFTRRCPDHRVDLRDIACSSGLAVALTLGCVRWVIQLLLLRFALVSPRHYRDSLSPG